MPFIFRTKEHLTVAQFAWSWARELATDKNDFQHEHANLVQAILEDIVNGRFDETGPLRDGRRLGLRVITEEGKAGFIEGRKLSPVLIGNPALSTVLHRIIIMKEAALDFARRRQLEPPGWWTDAPDLPASAGSKGLEPAATGQPWSQLPSGHPESP